MRSFYFYKLIIARLSMNAKLAIVLIGPLCGNSSIGMYITDAHQSFTDSVASLMWWSVPHQSLDIWLRQNKLNVRIDLE